MSEATATVETSEAPKTESPKAPAKPRPQPKGSKKPAAATTKASKTNPKAPAKGKGKKQAVQTKTPEYGMDKSQDVPWNDKKVAIFKALKSLKAFGATSAVSSAKIAEKSGLTPHDARHYCYHGKASGLIGIADIEDIRGYAFYLTTKGQKVDPAVELKAQKS